MGIINELKSVQAVLQHVEKSSPKLYNALGKMGFRLVKQTEGDGARALSSKEVHKNLKGIFDRRIKTVTSSKVKTQQDIRSIKLLRFMCSNHPVGRKTAFNRQWDKLLKNCDGDVPKAQAELKKQVDETLNKDQLEGLIRIVQEDGATRGLDRAGLLAVLETLESSRLEYGTRMTPGIELNTMIQDIKAGSILNQNVELKKLGGGAVNTVYSGTFVDSSGEEFRGVFKPEAASLPLSIQLREEIAGTAKQSGIPVGKSSFLDQRAFATGQVDQGLFGERQVNVKTYYAVVNGQRGIVMKMAKGGSIKVDGAQSTVVDKSNASPSEKRILDMFDDMQAAGKKITKKHLKLAAFSLGARTLDFKDGALIRTDATFTASKKEVNFYNPSLIEQYQRLQVLDIITGQVDRHPENYFVDIDDAGRPKLEAIDSDCAFGTKSMPTAKDVRNQHHLFLPNKGSLMLRMPTVITESIRDDVMNYSTQDLIRDLKDHISPEEIDAAAERLQMLKAHIRSDKCFVVETKQLLEPGYLKQLKPLNSYWARDMFVYRPKEEIRVMGPGGQVSLSGSSSWNYLREAQEY